MSFPKTPAFAAVNPMATPPLKAIGGTAAATAILVVPVATADVSTAVTTALTWAFPFTAVIKLSAVVPLESKSIVMVCPLTMNVGKATLAPE